MKYTISYKTKTPAKLSEMVKQGVTCYIEIHPTSSPENAEYQAVYNKMINSMYNKGGLEYGYNKHIHNPIAHLNNVIQSERELITDEMIEQVRNYSIECFGDSIVIDTLLRHDLDEILHRNEFEKFNDLIIEKRRSEIKSFKLKDIETEWFNFYQKKSRYVERNLGVSKLTMLSSNMFKILNEFRDEVLIQPKRVPLIVTDSGGKFLSVDDDNESCTTFDSFRLGFYSLEAAKKFAEKIYISYVHNITVSVINELSDKIVTHMEDTAHGLFISKRKNPINGNIGYITIKQFQYHTNVSEGNIEHDNETIKSHFMDEYSKIITLTNKYDLESPLIEFSNDILSLSSQSADLIKLSDNTSVVDLSKKLNSGMCNVSVSNFVRQHDLLKNIYIATQPNRYVRLVRHIGKIHIPINERTDISAIKKLFNRLKLTNIIDIRETSLMLLPFCMDDGVQEKLYEVLDELS